MYYYKKQRHYFADRGPYSQSYVISSSHVQMWELDHKEGWVLKNWSFQIMVLEKTLFFSLESPLDCKGIKLVNPKGNQPWTFIARTVVEAEAPILWPPDSKSQLTGKDWMLRKIEGKRRKVWQRMRWLDSITNSMTWIWDKFWEIVEDRGACHAIVHGVAKSQTCLSDWTTDLSALPWFSASSQAILSAFLPPSTSHTAVDFLSFKTQVKCHFSMVFPNIHPTSSHSNLARWTVPLAHVCCTFL